MKVTPRMMLRAGLVLCAAGALGAFGACKNSTSPVVPPNPPPPPPAGLPTPTGVTATPMSGKQINLAWTDTTAAVTRFQVSKCSGPSCTNFATLPDSIGKATKTFSDTGLTAGTSYTYRVRARSATDSSAWSTAVSATTLTTSGSGAFTLIGAGEITTCASSQGPMGTAHAVDSLLNADTSAIAFTIGNNLADTAQGSTFATCFDPKWGTFKARTYYAIGNADFSGGRGPTDVYGYLAGGAQKNTSFQADKGWYSFDKGNWHIVVLNTSDWEHGAGATFGIDSNLNPQPSEQVDWLSADLAAVPSAKCIAVISWERRFYTTSTGALGKNSNMRPMSSIMYNAHVDLLISAKDKLYARFAPMEPLNGTADSAGFRQFIVGTGGRGADSQITGTPPNRDAYIPGQWGVLKLTLKDNSYDWQFINTQVAGGPTDSGTANCHQ